MTEQEERAIEMLRIAADYIELNYPEGVVEYDEASCDGYCVAEDCRIAAEGLIYGEEEIRSKIKEVYGWTE